MLMMSLTQEEENMNLKLAQLKFSIDQKLISKDCDWIFQKLDSINSKAVASAYLKSDSPELIGCTALHFAVRNQNLKALRILLSRGANFTAKNQVGCTALHLAIKQLSNLFIREVELLKTKSEFVNEILIAHMNYKNFENPCDRNGLSHFHAACIMNYVELVEHFLVSGISAHDAVNRDSPYFPEYTPLHFAARFFALETVELLLKHGANRNLKNAQGLTPMHLLLKKSNDYMRSMDEKKYASRKELIKGRIVKIIRLFIEDVIADDMMLVDEFGLSQFHLICSTQDLPSIEHYLSKVVNIDHAVNEDSLLCPGYTALHFAALFSIETVKMLVMKGVNLGVEDANGMTPFDLCLEMYNAEEIHAILSLHPDWKDIVFGDRKTKSSNIVLRSCPIKLLDLVLAMRDLDECVEFIKSSVKKANVFIPLNSLLWPGFTPLHVVVSLCKNSDNVDKCKEIFIELRKRGVDFNSQDYSRGRTAINLAFQQGKRKIVKALISCCHWEKLTNVVDEDGLSHLHILCSIIGWFPEIPIAPSWLSNVEVNVVYKGQWLISFVTPGSTPLHVAIASSSCAFYIWRRKLEQSVVASAKDWKDMSTIHSMTMKQDASHDNFRSGFAVILKSPSLVDSVVEDMQLSHLHVACYLNVEASVEKLIELGANVNLAVARRANDIDERLNEFVGFTPLHFAAINRNRRITKLLIQRGADILAKDADGWTPLHLSLIYDQENLDLFAKVLKNDVDLQKRMESDVGLTMLHVACRLVDVELMKDLLTDGANVNARVHADSSIWPGFTPLHVWASIVKKSDKAELLHENVLNLLLEHNAIVTIGDAAGDTPLHIVCKKWRKFIMSSSMKDCILSMLRAHRDFRVNPVNTKGISLFHLVCSLGELNMVEKYLECGQVDVNKAVDPFSNDYSGCTPLHMALKYSYLRPDLFAHVDMVDLLFRYGADVHAESCAGNTPLHFTSFHKMPEDLLERLVREGADANRRNVKGDTPLAILLRKSQVAIEKIRYFLKSGCRLNTSNPVTGESYLTLAFTSMTFEAFQDLIFKTSINFPDLLKPDEEGRTVIHNIVSVSSSNITKSQYNQVIGKLLRKNFDVDDQDKLGRTALHFAAKYFNPNAVSALLDAGADVNVLDSSGQSAFTNVTDVCKKLKEMKDVQKTTILNLFMHVKKLLFCRIHVSSANLYELRKEFCQGIAKDDPLGERFKQELVEIRKVKIGSYSITLGNFSSELGAVSDYPTMSQMKRDGIDEFFTSIDSNSLEKYGEIAGLLRLQYRKALARVNMIERANESLTTLAGFRLPDICSQIILKLLPNSDLKNLINIRKTRQTI